MRMMDIIAAFPGFILAMAIAGALGPSIPNLIIAIAFVNVPVYARLSRARFLVIRHALYSTAARGVGATNWRILWWHLLPEQPRPDLRPVDAPVRLGDPRCGGPELHRPRGAPADPGVGRHGRARGPPNHDRTVVDLLLPGPRHRDHGDGIQPHRGRSSESARSEAAIDASPHRAPSIPTRARGGDGPGSAAPLARGADAALPRGRGPPRPVRHPGRSGERARGGQPHGGRQGDPRRRRRERIGEVRHRALDHAAPETPGPGDRRAGDLSWGRPPRARPPRHARHPRRHDLHDLPIPALLAEPGVPDRQGPEGGAPRPLRPCRAGGRCAGRRAAFRCRAS